MKTILCHKPILHQLFNYIRIMMNEVNKKILKIKAMQLQ